MNLCNFESELDNLITTHLAKQYQLKESALYHYFFLRHFIARCGSAHFSTNDKSRFLLEELNMPFDSKGVRYRNTTIPLITSSGHSIANIVTNWEFRLSIETVSDEQGYTRSAACYVDRLKEQLAILVKLKEKQSSRQISLSKKTMLDFLNGMYRATPTSPDRMQGVQYPDHHNDYKRTLEEVLDSECHAWGVETSHISEEELEDFLVEHPDVIEKGLIIVRQQMTLPDGRIDLLAKDSVGNLTIIELKTEPDKDLVWQAVHYPREIQKQYPNDRVRMITLLPEYPDYLLYPLHQLKGIEPMVYTIEKKWGKITSLIIQPAKKTTG